ncbi:MAG TPA: 4Fe-4S dicluster domain-containing protein [Planctomycetota bacterium]|nr:4Fe-4S dicluster domain-containing protein [Planctomycetota bacterium]
MRLGFLLNQETCIGCHACTVACKSEHGVPLGAFRTWVKHIEKGTFPDVRRHFSVMRCNHCDDAPCMDICPTKALFRRKDGVVDFDRDACIGCKSCLQACPYDALYIDPESNTAAKCNFCAHRLDAGLEPACVIVCPVQAIGVGDLDDPNSSLSKIVAAGAEVRKPELRTKPKTFYIGADAASLDPLQIDDRGPYPFTANGPVIDGEPGLIREIYDVPHPAPWGWKVWSYLWTKSIAAGILLVAAILGFSRPTKFVDHRLEELTAPLIALAFIAITSILLIFDLKRPERFWYMLTRPNWNSWLVRGSVALGAFGAVALIWILAPSKGLYVASVPISLITAGYTAFLFRQAKGREFWGSPWLFLHLLVQAIVAGAAVMTILAPMYAGSPGRLQDLRLLLGISLCAHAILARIESRPDHGSLHVRRAASEISRGAHAKDFLWNVLIGGTLVPLVLLVAYPFAGDVGPSWTLMASLLALWGLYRWERMWTLAGQSVPLS